jgi:ankyrin repeat protein
MDNEFTPLHFAAQEGHIDIVRELIAAGAMFKRVPIMGTHPCTEQN